MWLDLVNVGEVFLAGGDRGHDSRSEFLDDLLRFFISSGWLVINDESTVYYECE